MVHYIACDGLSFGRLARDLCTAYAARAAGREPHWTPLQVQYADYTFGQRELFGEHTDPDSLLTEQLSYWRTALDSLPEQLALPTDRPRPPVASGRGGTVEPRVPPAFHERLTALGRAGSARLFMVLQAGLAALLSWLGSAASTSLSAARWPDAPRPVWKIWSGCS